MTIDDYFNLDWQICTSIDTIVSEVCVWLFEIIDQWWISKRFETINTIVVSQNSKASAHLDKNAADLESTDRAGNENERCKIDMRLYARGTNRKDRSMVTLKRRDRNSNCQQECCFVRHWKQILFLLRSINSVRKIRSYLIFLFSKNILVLSI